MADMQVAPKSIDPSTTAAEEKETSELAPKDRLADLIARATALYAVKDYPPAAELYSQATELQAEINGEMAPENADLLYSYGKCLYFVAVGSSDVLGAGSAAAKLSGKGAPAEGKPPKKRKMNGESSAAADVTNGTANQPAQPTPAESIPGLELIPKKEKDDKAPENKPYFQITGDENWDDSESEGEGEDGEDAAEGDEEEGEEEQDDFSLAFEVLDMARVLLLRKLEILQQSALESADKGKYVASIELTPPVREVKDRIADVHDLQAEIALEGERYANAIDDLRAALALKEELYPYESNYVAECHYKLSLALEFGSKTQQRDEEGNPVGEPQIDEAMRQDSIIQMENAVDSCQRRIKKELVEVDNLEAGAKRDAAMKDIENVREIVVEMEQRLVDLRADPVNAVEEVNKEPKLAAADAAKLLEELTGKATDLSGLVKRKKPKGALAGGATESGSATPEPSAAATNGASSALGKRKVGFADEVDVVEAEAKKARVEDTEDSGL